MLKLWMVITEALAEARQVEDSFWVAGPRRELIALRNEDERRELRFAEQRAA